MVQKSDAASDFSQRDLPDLAHERSVSRRRVLHAAGSGAALIALQGLGMTARAQSITPIRFVLDWKYQGIHSWYYLAQDRGYFANEKIDLKIGRAHV